MTNLEEFCKEVWKGTKIVILKLKDLLMRKKCICNGSKKVKKEFQPVIDFLGKKSTDCESKDNCMNCFC